MLRPLYIFGLCGKARSGKDTVANHLVTHYGFRRIAYADAVRSAWDAIDGPTRELSKCLNLSYRECLQQLATECGRSMADDIWINILQAKVKFLYQHVDLQKPLRIVVPDIRYPNEAAALRWLWSTLHMEVPFFHSKIAHILRDVPLPQVEAKHSDTIIADLQIPNYGTIADLFNSFEDGLKGWLSD